MRGSADPRRTRGNPDPAGVSWTVTPAIGLDSAPWRTHSVPVRRLLLLATLLPLGCAPAPTVEVQATGLVVDGAGTPVPDLRISQYELTFIVDGHAMRHRYTEDTDGSFPGIVTGPDGRFTIHDSDLLLSYEWVREEEVCWDECIAFETVCDTFEEEVCDLCTFEECWDDCWEECDTYCWDEEICATYEDGSTECWIETYCEEESCETVCEPVCDTWTEPCDCRIETWDECFESCVETEEQCEWVTRRTMEYPTLGEIEATEARISLPETEEDVLGENIVSSPVDELRWRQSDRFVLP